jgi:hypothetical protein
MAQTIDLTTRKLVSVHDAWAAHYEGEGRAAYSDGTSNPYNPGSMANTRFARGWHLAATEAGAW